MRRRISISFHFLSRLVKEAGFEYSRERNVVICKRTMSAFKATRNKRVWGGYYRIIARLRGGIVTSSFRWEGGSFLSEL